MTKEVELLTSKDRNKNERNNTICTSSSIDVYLGMIERLRTEEEFSVETTRKLQTHPCKWKKQQPHVQYVHQ